MHLLRTESRTLDEAEAAVDLDQTPADLVFLSFSDSDLAAVAAQIGGEAFHAKRTPHRVTKRRRGRNAK